MQARETQAEKRRPRMGRRYSEGEIRKVLAAQVASGLGVLPYCRREGLSQATLYRWRERIERGRGDLLGVRAGKAARAAQRSSAGRNTATALVPLILRGGDGFDTDGRRGTDACGAGEVEVHLGGGVTARVTSLTESSARWVAALVAELCGGSK